MTKKKKHHDKGWLKFQYATLNRSPEDIAKECRVDTVTIFRQLRDFNLLREKKNIIEAREPLYQNEEWLKYQYVELKRKIDDIAKECNISSHAIDRWLKVYNIKIPISRMGIWTDKKWLKRQYIDLNKSADEIAKMCKTHRGTIFYWLRRLGIKRPIQKPKYQDEKWLRHQYIDLRKSQPEIAKELEVSSTTISNWIIRFNIPIRPKTELKIKGDAKYTDKEWLKKRFEDKSKPIYKIAEECGICTTTLNK